ncbi:MAG TPA: UPF0236 family protein [Blastocatellia bacterium]|nr:UPF0236 family protein [Blastocatellia bacterium]
MKTIHGRFAFQVQRFGSGAQATTWLEQSQQVLPGQVSRRLGEFGAYYANRMSYEEVASLVERLTGEKLLSDQTIWQQVVAQAAAVSQGWSEETAAVEPLETVSEVDWYDRQSPEVLVLSDAIQVKQQKPRRYRTEQQPAEEPQRERVRVNTDVWLVERASGGRFQYLMAGINQAGEEVVSVAARVRQCLQTEYGGGDLPLPVVAITDGAKAIRCQLATIFGHPLPVILDWYHLEKKIWELMSAAARTKTEKEAHVSALLKLLWRGQTKEALHYLHTQVESRSEKWLAALCTYLEKHEVEIIDYERRQKAGKAIGSGRMEKGVDQVIGARQKSKGMSWSPTGSKALGILKVVELNGQWNQLWFPENAAT